MALVRSVILVDGENLVFRFQEMLKSGMYAPKSGLIYEPDLLVWHSSMFKMWGIDNFRVNYYISVIGDDNALTHSKKKISANTNYQDGNYYQGCNIIPCAFKKPSKSHKSRLVDINLTVEAMRMAYSDQIDVICIVSGDGDFIEVYNDIKRRGKQVCVAALSRGLNLEVPTCVDRFFNLDELLLASSCEVADKDFHVDFNRKIGSAR